MALLVLAYGFALPWSARAADDLQTLSVVEVTESPENVVGATDSASQGVIPRKAVEADVTYEPGELLETVPGLDVTQHSGEGKANQYFLRGVNLDHGTDIRITVDDVDVNARTHAHGHGYADLNFLMPELISGIAYKKGPYYADEGDFSTVGAIHIGYVDTLEKGIAKVTVGQDNYERVFLADSSKLGMGNLLYGFEVVHDDGPWKVDQDFRKLNGVLRYSLIQGQDSLHIEAMAYGSEGTATNQIPRRAVEEGLIGLYGSLNPFDGEVDARYSLSGSWQHTGDNSVTKANAYVIVSRLNLWSDFTFFLTDPVHGDQFEQIDRRVTEAANFSHSWLTNWGGRQVQNTVGLQLQNDTIGVGLDNTEDRHFLSTIRSDHVVETSAALYFQNSIQWLEKFRTEEGGRTDFYWFDVTSNNPANSGIASAHMTNPKFSAIFGPWDKTEYFINAGGGFHSNDARGTTITEPPTSGPGANIPAQKVTPLVRTEGYEVGARTSIIPGLQSSLALYRMDFASELVFDGDAGSTTPGRASRRDGFELTNVYTPAPWPWLSIRAEFADVEARYTAMGVNPTVVANHIPGAVEGVGAFSVAVNNLGAWFGSLQLRYKGPYPLIEDNTERAPSTTLVNGRLGYKITKSFAVTLDGINLTNSKAANIAYYYASRLQGEPAAGVNDVHFHPVEPITFRLGFMYYF
jgi:hypothetical protein